MHLYSCSFIYPSYTQNFENAKVSAAGLADAGIQFFNNLDSAFNTTKTYLSSAQQVVLENLDLQSLINFQHAEVRSHEPAV